MTIIRFDNIIIEQKKTKRILSHNFLGIKYNIISPTYIIMIKYIKVTLFYNFNCKSLKIVNRTI